MSNYLSDPRRLTFEGEIAALHIFAKYDPKGLQGHFDVEHRHDIGYGPCKPAPMPDAPDLDNEEDDECLRWSSATREDAKTLSALGWHWDSDSECWAQF